MYYSSGNYEAFATTKKPESVDSKSAYIVGSGLAALSAACYLVHEMMNASLLNPVVFAQMYRHTERHKGDLCLRLPPTWVRS